MRPLPPSPPAVPLRETLRSVAALVRPRRRLVVGIVASMAGAAGATAGLAFAVGPSAVALSRSLTSEGDPAAGPPELLGLGAALVGALIARAACNYAQSVLTARLELGVVKDLRRRLHRHLLSVGASVPGVGSGELAARVAYETAHVRLFLTLGATTTIRNLTMALGLSALAFSLAPALAATCLLALPPVVAITVFLSRRARAARYRASSAEARVGSVATEHASLLMVLRGFEAEEQAAARFDRMVERAEVEALAAARIEGLSGPAVQLTGAAVVAGLLALLAGTDLAAGLPPATAASLVATVILLYGPLRGLSGSVVALSSGLSAMDRLAELERLPRADGDAGDRPLPPMTEALELVNVRAGYEGRGDVLRGVSLRLTRGEAVGVTGPSGAGKTTLLRVLSGLQRPSAGKVTIDGVPLDEARAEDVRGQFAWVFQEPTLLAESVASNVALGDESPDEAELAAALEAAGARGFVEALPDGARTVLQEGGGDLSVGQRQRLCIARALYRDAPVLVLDEPTSALDPEGEREVGRTLAALLREERTVVLVSHREELLRHTSRLIVLSEGRIVSDGPTKRALDEGPSVATLTRARASRG